MVFCFASVFCFHRLFLFFFCFSPEADPRIVCSLLSLRAFFDLQALKQLSEDSGISAAGQKSKRVLTDKLKNTLKPSDRVFTKKHFTELCREWGIIGYTSGNPSKNAILTLLRSTLHHDMETCQVQALLICAIYVVNLELFLVTERRRS